MERNTEAIDNTQDKKDANVLPATEVVANPNPRANENIRERTAQPGTQSQGSQSAVNSEITDGEDA